MTPPESSDIEVDQFDRVMKTVVRVVDLAFAAYLIWVILPPAAKIEVKAKLSQLRRAWAPTHDETAPLRFSLYEIERSTPELLGAEVSRLPRVA